MINIENITIPSGKILRCPYFQKEHINDEYALCGEYYCRLVCPYFSYKEIKYDSTIIGCKYSSYAEAMKQKKEQKKNNSFFNKLKNFFKL